MKKPLYIALLPLFGAVLFLFLYVAAAKLYPGGSQFDANETGFSFKHGYWCNLLNEKALNGQTNKGRPFAIASLLTLILTLGLFWYIFPIMVVIPKNLKRIIQFSGFASMTTVIFISSKHHDFITNIASFFGLIAVCGTILALRKLPWTRLFWFGVFNILLVVVNNILYYGDGLQLYLPVVQKITFTSFLLWICLTNIKAIGYVRHQQHSVETR